MELVRRINHTFQDEFITHLVMEEPTSMGEVGRSTNSLGKLMFMAGAIAQAARMTDTIVETFWYPTNTWKGSLPKHAVTKRVNRVLDLTLNAREGYNGMETDIADAIGVGLYHISQAIGQFNHDNYFGRGSRT